MELEELPATRIIKVKIQRKPSQAMLKTYKMNMSTFDNSQPEEFLALKKTLNNDWRNRQDFTFRQDQLSTYYAT